MNIPRRNIFFCIYLCKTINNFEIGYTIDGANEKKYETNKRAKKIENKNGICSENDDNGVVVKFINMFYHFCSTYHHLVLSFIHFTVVMCRFQRNITIIIIVFALDTRILFFSSTERSWDDKLI